jgi:hypothetical protein
VKEQLRAALADLVPPTAIAIHVWLVFLYKGKPHPSHLQENDSLLFVLGGACHFQALSGETKVLVRPAHRASPNYWLTIDAGDFPMFPKSVIFGDRSKVRPRFQHEIRGVFIDLYQ